MTLREPVRSSVPSMRSSTSRDSPVRAATPEPTVLSTVWEGPPADRDAQETADRSTILGWLLAPTTTTRALVITTVTALVCAGAVAATELSDEPLVSTTLSVEPGSESTQGTLGSRAVAAEREGDVADATDAAIVDPGANRRQAVSADDRLLLTATPRTADSGEWIIEAETVPPSAPVGAVVFTVNGVVRGRSRAGPVPAQPGFRDDRSAR